MKTGYSKMETYCSSLFFARIILIVIICVYVWLIVSVCILFEISGFWLKMGILVILDSEVFWSFDEQG